MNFKAGEIEGGFGKIQIQDSLHETLRHGPSSPENLAREQKQQAAVKLLVDSVADSCAIDQATKQELAKLAGVLLEHKISTAESSDIRQLAKSLEKQFLSVADLNGADKFSSIVSQLYRTSTAYSGPEDLAALKIDIATDVLRELSDPAKNIHQGVSLACAVTSREYIKANPVIYAEFIADIVSTGSGHLGRDQAGNKFGQFSYQPGMLGELKERTLGAALYMDIMLNNLGSPEQGLMPLDVERFMEARGQAARLMTHKEGVSETPQAIDSILKAIKYAADHGKAGLISLEFSDGGAHAKHVLELCSSKGVPDGYVKLSNPWEPGTPLPKRYQKMVIDNGDGTFLMKEKDLKANLYFAVLETGDKADLGKTHGAREGVYRKDIPEGGGQIFEPAVSHFGFSCLKKRNPAADKPEKSEEVRDTKGSLDLSTQVKPILTEEVQLSKKAEEPQAAQQTEGSKYFVRLNQEISAAEITKQSKRSFGSNSD